MMGADRKELPRKLMYVEYLIWITAPATIIAIPDNYTTHTYARTHRYLFS